MIPCSVPALKHKGDIKSNRSVSLRVRQRVSCSRSDGTIEFVVARRWEPVRVLGEIVVAWGVRAVTVRERRVLREWSLDK